MKFRGLRGGKNVLAVGTMPMSFLSFIRRWRRITQAGKLRPVIHERFAPLYFCDEPQKKWRELSPHPGPLPWGEGGIAPAMEEIRAFGSSEAAESAGGP